MNIGYSSRLPYDDCAYPDKLKESTDPLKYVLSTDKIYNCNRCLSTLGPRSSHMGHGVSTYRDTTYAEAQDLVDIDSIFSNRNVKTSKCKKGHINPINPTKFREYHTRICNNTLDPEYSRLSYPSANYRDMSINRFYNTIHDPQEPIFWDFAVNTSLEEKDNFVPDIPQLWPDLAGPMEDRSNYTTDIGGYKSAARCPKGWNS